MKKFLCFILVLFTVGCQSSLKTTSVDESFSNEMTSNVETAASIVPKTTIATTPTVKPKPTTSIVPETTSPPTTSTAPISKPVTDVNGTIYFNKDNYEIKDILKEIDIEVNNVIENLEIDIDNDGYNEHIILLNNSVGREILIVESCPSYYLSSRYTPYKYKILDIKLEKDENTNQYLICCAQSDYQDNVIGTYKYKYDGSSISRYAIDIGDYILPIYYDADNKKLPEPITSNIDGVIAAKVLRGENVYIYKVYGYSIQEYEYTTDKKKYYLKGKYNRINKITIECEKTGYLQELIFEELGSEDDSLLIMEKNTNTPDIETFKYGLSIIDYNFDGILDISMWTYQGGTAMNIPTLYWVWDETKQEYVYNKELSNSSSQGWLTILKDTKELCINIKCAIGYTKKYYKWNNNELVNEKSITSNYDANNTITHIITEELSKDNVMIVKEYNQGDELLVFKELLLMKINNVSEDESKINYISGKTNSYNIGRFFTELTIDSFTLFDFDSDGINELVILYGREGYEILKYNIGSVTGYGFNYRSMTWILPNRMVSFSGGASYTGFGTIKFENNTATIKSMLESIPGEIEEVVYIDQNGRITEEIYYARVSELLKEEPIGFFKFTEENINKILDLNQ